jgi:acetyl esterase/lipase
MKHASSVSLVILLALGAIAAASGDDGPKKARTPTHPRTPPKIEIEKDVAYLADDRPEKADLYLPARRAARVRSPAVVVIHGGGWTSGDKAHAREVNIAENLARNGFVALSINYVLCTGGNVTWPQNLNDCKTAVRWLRKNAQHLQVDPEHIGAIGGSAGGHLAALLAVTGPDDGLDPKGTNGEFSCRVQCAVDLYGPIDLLSYRDLPMFGKTRKEAPQLYRAASPSTYVDRNDPPILILHGTADRSVDVAQSQRFAAALQQAGARHELVLVDGAPHAFHLQPKEVDLRPLVMAFFHKHLRPHD